MVRTLLEERQPASINLMDFGSETEDEMLEAENEFETQQQLEKLAQRVLNHLDWCKNSTDRQDAEKRWEDCQNFWLNKQWNGIKSFGIRGRDSATKRLHPNPVDNYFTNKLQKQCPSLAISSLW